MWTLKKPTFAVRLTENEMNELNAVLSSIQDANGVFRSAKDVLNHFVTHYEPIKTAETIEVIEEVEEQPTLIGFFMELTENELEALQKIASNRAKKSRKEPETLEQIVRGMIFNEASLYNHSFKFYTGL